MSVFVETFSLGGSGLSVAVKDSIDVAGFQTKAGCEGLDSIAAASCHADVVANILQAGCQLVGKLNMHELAFGMTGVNHWTGTPVNPHYPKYIPGGSSSGSAVAVAQGDVDFALGTDTGGSIRVPAACCGVYGLKPSFGRVSRKGVMPADSSLDCVGPLARSAEGIIEAMAIIAPDFKPVSNIGPITLGRVSVDSDPRIQTLIDTLLERVAFDCVDIELPSMKAAFEAGVVVINAETWRACGQYLQTGKVGLDVAHRLEAARDTSANELVVAEDVRKRFSQEVDTALTHASVLVMPTLPHFPLTREHALAGRSDLTTSALVRPFNLSGHPAISIPLKEAGSRPVALQLIAGKGQDELLCEVARLLSPFIG